MGKWILVLLALILAITSAAVIFTITGVIEPEDTIISWAEKTSWLQPHIEVYRMGQENDAWQVSAEEELAVAWAEIAEAENELKKQKDALSAEEASLKELAEQLQQREQAVVAAEQARRNIQGLAELYREMPANESARIIQQLDQDTIVELLAALDPRDAATILALFPTELAASISKQLKEVP